MIAWSEAPQSARRVSLLNANDGRMHCAAQNIYLFLNTF